MYTEQQKMQNRDLETINDLEQKVKNNYFKTKDELFEEMVKLRNNGMGAILDNRKMRELLDLFDSLKSKEETPLDMQNYKSVELENTDLIVSKTDDRVLTTLEGSSAFTDEFTQKQNEILANSKDGVANADAVFESMANHEKEESTLIPLSEAPLHNGISIEILKKISFFTSNIYIDPRVFKVDIEKGIFYNTETSEVLEVRKNEQTNQYEIYSGKEKIYGNNSIDNQEPTLNSETQEEEKAYEDRLNKPKVRIKKPEFTRPQMMGFTKISFLVINIITFITLTILAIILYK